MIENRREESLILRLIALGEGLKRRRDKICQELGVSSHQWLILLYLAKDPNLPFYANSKQKKPVLPSELAKSLAVSRPNIAKFLTILSEKGLIRQVDDNLDRRRKRLELSEAGLALVASLQPMRELLNHQLFEHFEGKELDTVLIFLNKCLNRLETF